MRRLLLKLRRRRTIEQDIAAELAFHREMAAAGSNPIPFGNSAVITDQALDLWRFSFLENVWRDLVYAARGLRRSPAFVLTALLSLGLGIGANTAMFSLALEFLMSEPSVKDAASLVHIRLGGASHVKPEILEFVRSTGVFQDVAGENAGDTFINWNDGRETRRIFCVQTTLNYFDVAGVPVSVGRGWSAKDDRYVAVLSYPFWRKHFNSDPAAIGKAIHLDDRSYTILGVLPESHRTLLGYGFSPDVYIPAYLPDTILSLYARLKPGMSLGEATAAVTALAHRLDEQFRHRYKYSQHIQVSPSGGFHRLGRDKQTMAIFFLALLIVVGLVLLIAAINVASMLLARASVRRQEIAIRLSLGASKARLLQQLMSESMLLCVLGGALGLFLAYVVARAIAAIDLPLPVPVRLQIEPDWRVALYAAFMAGFATIVAGLMPAWQSVRTSLNTNLKREQRLRLRRVLVGAQIAVCLVVLATGGLFLRNLISSSSISPGFDVRRTIRADVHLPPARYREAQRLNTFFDQALDRLSSVPGVESAAAARIVPFTDASNFATDITLLHNSQKKHARFHWNAVSPAYFDAMSIPLRAGRVFAASDARGDKVVIVNETFVRRYVADRDPVGTSFYWHDARGRFTIVGVVADTKNITIGEDDRGQMYQPLSQIVNDRARIQFVLRSALPPATQLEGVRTALRGIEPAAGIEVETMYSSVGMAFLPSQIGAVLMGGIGVLGLILAAVGLYGVMGYSVSQRTREIGIRIAIGAGKREISRMVLMDAVKLLFWGTLIGLAVAVLVTKPLAMFFVPGLSPTDPASYAAVLLVLGATAILATLGPLRRATTIDPARCLRYE